MDTPSTTPAAAGAVAAAAVGLTILARVMPDVRAATALVPGSALFLGSHNVFSFFTAHFLSPSWALLVVHAAVVYALGARVEAPAGPHTSARVLTTVCVAAGVAGLVAYFARLSLFMSAGEEVHLYRPVEGCGPLAAALAVLATEALGDAPLHAAFALPASQVPLCLVLLSFLTQNAGLNTADAGTTLTAVVVSWAFLRFFTAHGPGGPIGDARDEFEFLIFVPGPLRVILRPLEKVATALLMPLTLRVASAAAGSRGLAALAPPSAVVGATAPSDGSDISAAVALYGTGGAGGAAAGASGDARFDLTLHLHDRLAGTVGGANGGAGGVATDPIAERRREKALKSLDRRLAEMRQKLKGGPAGAASASPQQAGSTAAAAPAAASPAAASPAVTV